MRTARLWLERQMHRGPATRFGLIAAAIVGVSLAGGALATALAGAEFAGPGEATWWAFLRLTDPGYLGEDDGLAKRLVSLGLTLAGMVLFMGALVAIMTTSLDEAIARLERGETPVDASDHFLVVGWTPRSAAIVREFLLSETRVGRFLARRGVRGLHVVLLAEHLDAHVSSDVALRLGDLADDRKVTLRAGSRLRVDHLERAAFTRAAAILLPGEGRGEGTREGDTAVIKTLMSIASHPRIAGRERPPRVVAEVFDPRKAALARVAYPGELDVVASDALVGRLVVQNLQNPGLSYLYDELLSHHRGAAVYAPEIPALTGRTFGEAAPCFPDAALLGAVRDGAVVHLAPDASFRFEAGDRAVLVAPGLAEAERVEPADPWTTRGRRDLPAPEGLRRLLLLGWSEKVPALLQELSAHSGTRWEVCVVSLVPAEARTATLAAYGPLPGDVDVAQHEADFTLPAEMARLDPAAFDHVVLLGSDWVGTDEAADARAIVGYLTLRETLGGDPPHPHVLVELTDPENANLFDARRGEVVVSPVLVSHVLAHVTLRRELLPIFDTLFRAGGPSFSFRPATAYGAEGTVSFAALRARVHAAGHAAVGVRPRDPARREDLRVLPPGPSTWPADDIDVIVVAPVGG